MDGKEYLEKFVESKTLEEKVALLAKAKEEENEDRALFARKRDSWEVPELDNPYKGLIPVFEDPENGGDALFTNRNYFKEEEKIPRLFDVGAEARAKKRNQPPTVPNLSKFKEQFLTVFSCNELQFINWDNIVAAGGSVSACVEPLPADHDTSFIQRRKYYHDIAYGASDVDLFLYGLTPAQANKKLVEIYEAICTACPFEVVCFRSANAVTMVSQYPYRHIQVVLRIYNSPYEVLAGFDIDSCTFLYDGNQVFTTPRGHHALMSGYNSIDISRRSPSYEIRLAKYASRGFEVLLPTFQRDRVDPNVFDKPWPVLQGLQKLVVLEKLRTAEARLEYQTRHHKESDLRNRLRARRNLDKRELERMEKVDAGSEQSNYATVFLPWGEGYNAKTVMKLMKKKDLALNSRHFMKDRSYYLHPCFFGTASEILEDGSPDDPEIPDDAPEEHIRSYVRGRLTWLEDDPGRQQIGSFNPITDQDWEEGSYFLYSNFDVCDAVNRNDINDLKLALEKLGPDWSIYQRDYLGRSPLHMGLLSGSLQCCLMLLEEDLVDPTLRLPDGRSTLHLVAEYNRPQVMGALLSSVKRFEEKWEGYEKKTKAEKNALEATGKRPPRRISLAEFVKARTFDQKWTALDLSVILGRVEVARIMLEDFGSDCSELIPLKPFDFTWNFFQNVSEENLCLLLAPPQEETKLEEMIDVLLDHGFDKFSDFLDKQLSSALHKCVEFGNSRLLKAILEGLERRGREELVKKLVQWIDINQRTPLIAAVENGFLECAQLLYARYPHVYITAAMKENRKLIESQLGFVEQIPYHIYIQMTKGNENLVSAAMSHLIYTWMVLLDPKRQYLTSRLICWPMGFTLFTDPVGSWAVSSNRERLYADSPVRTGIFAEEDEDDHILGEDSRKQTVDQAVECLLWTLEISREGKHNTLQHTFEMPSYLKALEIKPMYLTCDRDPRKFDAKPVSVPELMERIFSLFCGLYEEMTLKLGLGASERVKEEWLTKFLKECSEDSFDHFVYQTRLDSLKVEENPNLGTALVKIRKLIARLKALKELLCEYAESKERRSSAQSIREFLRGLRKSTRKPNLKDNVLERLFADYDADIEVEEVLKVAKSYQLKESLAEKEKEMNEELYKEEVFDNFSVLTRKEERAIKMSYTSRYCGTKVSDSKGRILNAFRAAYKGNVDTVVEFVTKTTDLGFSPFLLNFGSSVSLINLTIIRCCRGSRVETMRRLYALALERYKPPSKMNTANKQGGGRVDNIKLMETLHSNIDSDDCDESMLEFSNDLNKFKSGDEAKRVKDEQSDHFNHESTAIRIHPALILGWHVPISCEELNAALSPQHQKAIALIEKRRFRHKRSFQFKWKAVWLGEFAILKGDAELLREFLEITRTVSVPEAPLKCWAARFTECSLAAIACDSVECLEILISQIGGGVNWGSIAFNLGLKGVFSQKSSTRYQGVSSVLEQKSSRQEGECTVDRSVAFARTWMDFACVCGSQRVIEWIFHNPNEVVEAFDSFLENPSKESELIVQTLLRLSEKVTEEIVGGRIPALQKIANVKELLATPGSVLFLLAVRSGRGDLTELNIRGESVMYCMVIGNSVAALAEILGKLTSAERDDALNAPCKQHYQRKETNQQQPSESGQIGQIIEEYSPMHVAAFVENLAILRLLLEHGADPLQTTSIGKQNALQIMVSNTDFGSNESLAVLRGAICCFEELVGRKTLIKVLGQTGMDGMNCFHLAFLRGKPAVSRALFDGLIEPAWINTKQDGSSLLQIQLESPPTIDSESSVGKVNMLLEYVDLHSIITEENAKGQTAIDLLLKMRRTEHRPFLVGRGVQQIATYAGFPSKWMSKNMLASLEDHPLYSALTQATSTHLTRSVPSYKDVYHSVISKFGSGARNELEDIYFTRSFDPEYSLMPFHEQMEFLRRD